MFSAAQLSVVVSADISGAQAGLSRLNGLVSSTGGFLSRVASTALGVLGGNILFSGLQNAFQGTIGGAIALNDTLENNRMAFTQMLGSGQAAQAFLSDLQAFAARTPFTFVGLAESAKRLLAFGFEASQVLPLLTDIGNAAKGLGLGQEGINRLTIALGQMLAKGRVQGDELLQLQEAGVNTGAVFAIMAQQTGKSVEQLKKLQSAGKLDPKQFIAAFQAFSQQRFPNLLEAGAQTREGIWENIFEVKDTTLAAIFAPVHQALKDLGTVILAFTQTAGFAQWVARLQGWVGTLTTILGAFASTWSNLMRDNGLSFLQAGLVSTELILNAVFGEGAAAAFHGFVDGVRAMIGVAQQIAAVLLANGPAILAFIAGFQSVGLVVGIVAAIGAALAVLTSPITLIALAVGLLAAAWVGNWGGIQTTLTTFWTGTAQPILTELWTWLSTNVPAALATLAGFWTGTLLPALQAVWGFLSGVLLPLFAALGELFAAPWILTARILATALAPALALIGQALVTVGQSFVSFVLAPLQELWTWLSARIAPLLGAVAAGLAGLGQQVPGWLTNLTGVLQTTANQIAFAPVGPTGLGLPSPGVAPGGSGGNRSVQVTISGNTISDQLDVDQIAQQVAAAAAVGQAQASNAAPAEAPGG